MKIKIIIIGCCILALAGIYLAGIHQGHKSEILKQELKNSALHERMASQWQDTVRELRQQKAFLFIGLDKMKKSNDSLQSLDRVFVTKIVHMPTTTYTQSKIDSLWDERYGKD